MRCRCGGCMDNKFSDEEVGTAGKQKLVFALNGERVEIFGFDPSTTLLEFLRLHTPYKGAKLGCGEGGCGACVVLLSKYDKRSNQVEDFAISSCLTLLYSINGCSVTTTEGLGNCKDGFHSIHERFAGFHASQCGYCTPGMCMSLFSSLVNADKATSPDPVPPGFSKLTVSEAETAIAGNLCRCTGYRPIIDVCKSFARDVDIEDLGLNAFWEKKEDADANKLPLYIPNKICTFPDFLKDEGEDGAPFSFGIPPTHVTISKKENSSKGQWFRPSSITDLLSIMESRKEAKLVAGNTSSGIYKSNDYCKQYIDLTYIPELSEIRRDKYGVEFGAAVTLSRVIDTLLDEESKLGSYGGMVFRKISNHMKKVASKFVRNTATLGGNLIMAQRERFPSDIATMLLGAGSSVKLQISSMQMVLSVDEFLQQKPCSLDTVLVSVYVPNHIQINTIANGITNDQCATKTKLLFETYRAAPRPHGNAIAYLNAAFLGKASNDKFSGDFVLDHLHLAFGAFGTTHAVRAVKVEEFLIGKCITPGILAEAVQLLKKSIAPQKGTSSPAYRISLSVAFLFDFLSPLVRGLDRPVRDVKLPISVDYVGSDVPCMKSDQFVNSLKKKIYDREPSANLISERVCSIKSTHFHTEQVNLVSGRQVMDIHSEYYPVGQPTQKVGAELQASGEAIFVDDLSSPKNCLHGAFIYSTKPMAYIRKIELPPILPSQGSVTFVSYQDIPKGGENIGCQSILDSEPLFADVITQFVGQPIALVIAETRKDALLAAQNSKVYYDTENLEPPILSVEEAVSRTSFYQAPPFLCLKQVGDFVKGMSEADHKITSAEVGIGSQHYFYMETQTALAVPDEDNCLTVYSSTQVPETCQVVISKCLGVPEHNVRVISRRFGGGFGGKALRSVPIATSCALAAHLLRRPVRIYLDRKTDMVTVMGRHPMKVKYTVGFKDDAVITALHVDILIDAGISSDISPGMPVNIVDALKKYNWGSLSFDIKICKTNLLTKSSMRGPGHVQGSFIAETIIEHVAAFLCIEANDVRRRNLHTHESLKMFYGNICKDPLEYTLPLVVDKLITSSCFHSRAEIVRNFNSSHRWTKRGLSIVPIVFGVTLKSKPAKVSVMNDGSIVVEVGGTELGQGLWTKVKQMTAFCLGRLLNGTNNDLQGRVRIIQADTLTLVQGGHTSGSTTSEASCEAVRLACNILVERLTPVVEYLQEKSDPVSWEAVISQAHLQSVNLSASAYWVPSRESSRYLNFGAAASEVEVDLLTGATTILHTDITYDCGLSLNPAVDLGQIEGAFVQGIGFFMLEEHVTDSEGLVLSDGTWTYKIPTVDTIPHQLNVEIFSSEHHQNCVLSSKASGEPPLLLAASVHCATREAIKEARRDMRALGGSEMPSEFFRMDTPATMAVIKELCGFDNVEKYLQSVVGS